MENTSARNLANRLFPIVAVAMCLFHLYTVVRPSLDTIQQQAIHLCFALVLVFLDGMSIKGEKRPKKLRILADTLLLAGSVYTLVYILVKQQVLVVKIGTYTANDLFVGGALIFILFVATYRTFGKALPLLVGIFFLYGHFGYLVPGMLYHAGISWPRLIVGVTTNLSGVFGTVLEVSSTYIVLFMIFGGLLDASGAGNFFIRFAMSVGGKSRSGAAQAAVISSGLVGSINGSAVANVASTGVFTIPLMKDRGYEPHFAGAVEACASTGGMIMPPVMGVAAFVMSGITGIHCHNDFGLAAACTLAGAMAGAEVLSTTVNGLGERSGNTATEEILMALKLLYGKDLGVDTTRLVEASRLVERLSNVPMQKHKAVVGRHSFSHESGMVVAGVLEEPFVAEAYAPELVGAQREILIGKKSGAKSVEAKLETMGISMSEEAVKNLLGAVKETAIREKRSLSDEEFLALAKQFV